MFIRFVLKNFIWLDIHHQQIELDSCKQHKKEQHRILIKIENIIVLESYMDIIEH